MPLAFSEVMKHLKEEHRLLCDPTDLVNILEILKADVDNEKLTSLLVTCISLINRLNPNEGVPMELYELLNFFSGCIDTTRGQSWLIYPMQAAGYAVEDGQCYGYSAMGMQAFLADDMEAFSTRVASIFEIKRDVEKGALIPDVLPFFDGINLHQAPGLHSDFFETENRTAVQNYEKTIALTLPLKLINTPPVVVAYFPGFYNESEFVQYLDLLKEQLGSMSFSLMLACNGHSINLNYDSNTSRWILIDANRERVLEYIHHDLLAAAVIKGFSIDTTDTAFMMLTKVFTLSQQATSLKARFCELEKLANWMMLHHPDKTIRFGNTDWSLIGYAMIASCIDWIDQEFVANRVMTNHVLPGNRSLLGLACLSDSLELVSYILDKGADPNFLDRPTALWTATHDGNLGFVKLLLARNANPNLPCANQATALNTACKKGYLEVAKYLISNGATIDTLLIARWGRAFPTTDVGVKTLEQLIHWLLNDPELKAKHLEPIMEHETRWGGTTEKKPGIDLTKCTPLQLLVLEGRGELAAKLIRAGIDWKIPLHFRYKPKCKTLLELASMMMDDPRPVERAIYEVELDKYCRLRLQQGDYKRKLPFFNIGLGVHKNKKMAAAKALKAFMENDVALDPVHKRALSQGDLGKLCKGIHRIKNIVYQKSSAHTAAP